MSRFVPSRFGFLILVMAGCCSICLMADDVSDFNGWVAIYQRWPSLNGDDTEIRWSDWVREHGQKRNVYASYLEEGNKKYPLIKGAVDPLGAVDDWICLHPKKPKNRSKLPPPERRPNAAWVENYIANLVKLMGGWERVLPQLSAQAAGAISARARTAPGERGSRAARVTTEAGEDFGGKKESRMPTIESGESLGPWPADTRNNKANIRYQIKLRGSDPDIPAEVEITAFNQWLGQKKYWPIIAGDPEESRWAGWVIRLGGRERVYRDFVSPENKNHFLIQLYGEPLVAINRCVKDNKRMARDKLKPSPGTEITEITIEREVAKVTRLMGGRAKLLKKLDEENRKLFEQPPAVTVEKEPAPQLPTFQKHVVYFNIHVAKIEMLPLADSKSAEDRAWARWAYKLGKQKYIYENILTPENRELPLIKIKIDPLSVLETWLRTEKYWPDHLVTQKLYPGKKRSKGDLPPKVALERLLGHYVLRVGKTKLVALLRARAEARGKTFRSPRNCGRITTEIKPPDGSSTGESEDSQF